MKRILLIALLSFLSSQITRSQGVMVTDTVDAVSLKNNLIGEPSRQCIAVYLPLSYQLFSEKHYPVIYYLPDYGETTEYYLEGYYNGFFLDKTMNELTLSSKISEMIVVIINGYNRLGGSYFHNSPVTGNWEDFVVNDVVKHVDSLYRTLPQKESRAILGMSMGGNSAFQIAMNHPDIFTICVTQCADFVRPGEITKTPVFRDPQQIRRTYHLIDYLGQFSAEEAHRQYLDTITSLSRKGDWMMLMGLAYGSAFAPNPSLRAPYFDYPYFLTEDDALILNPDIMKRYEDGVGSLMVKVKKHSRQLRQLRGIGFAYGSGDLFRWIPAGNEYLDSLLTSRRIKHTTWVNEGGHCEQLPQQMEEAILPFINKRLDFNTGNFYHRRGKTGAKKQTQK